MAILLIPLWGMFIAYITGELKDTGYAMSQVRSMMYIAIFLFMVTMRLSVLLKAVWINGIIMAVVTLILFFLSELGGIFLTAIYEYCNVSGNFTMAYNRNFLGFTVNGLYLIAGSLIIFSFIYNLYQYKGRFKLLFSVILFTPSSYQTDLQASDGSYRYNSYSLYPSNRYENSYRTQPYSTT